MAIIKEIKGAPEPKIFRVWRIMPSALKIFLTIQIIFLFYISFSTEFVDNLQWYNTTEYSLNPDIAEPQSFEPNKVPLGFEPVILYGVFEDQRIFQEKDDVGKITAFSMPSSIGANVQKVPKSNVPMALSILYMMVSIVFMYIGSQQIEEEHGITSEEATRRTKEYFENSMLEGKESMDIDEFKIADPVPQVFLIKKTIGEKIIKDKWIVPVTTFKNNLAQFWIVAWDYATGDRIETTETKIQFSKKNVCPNCGQFTDEKIIMSEDYTRIMSLIAKTRKATE